jgi:hypothetical protein
MCFTTLQVNRPSFLATQSTAASVVLLSMINGRAKTGFKQNL